MIEVYLHEGKLRLFPPAWLLVAAICFPAHGQVPGQVVFSRDVAPIFSHKCMQCHGQEPLMGGLDLRNSETAMKGGTRGAVVVPGDAQASALYRHVAGLAQPQMPLGGRLSEREISTIKDWINGGAVWDSGMRLGGAPAAGEKEFTEAQRRHWAFQKLVKPALPAVKDREWARNPIDAFVKAKLEEKKIKPNPPADKITLIRRATMDLTGLPPTPEEVQAFVSDTSPDAFARVVDRLLASPHYGERWGRHWLDVARYADTNGFKSDETRPNIWRYRDYVIRSFNEDKPYDRFVREQIAGDELYPDNFDARIAVAFNRHFTEETNQPVIELRRQEILNDITDTVGAAFLGVTIGCARCHDHKFDPILQKDYYRLQAFFANIREDDDLKLLSGAELEDYQRRYAEWDSRTREIRREMRGLVDPFWKKRADYYRIRFSQGTREALDTPPENRTPIQNLLVIKAMPQITYQERVFLKDLTPEQRKRYQELENELKKHDSLKPEEPPIAQTIIDNGRVAPKTYVLAAGSWEMRREEVEPGFLTILDPAVAKITPPEGLNSTGRRTALANWLADPKNPLTTRVMANRLWHYHFGRGIAGSPSDFGLMGERPAHPELLDHLAVSFTESGWSIKGMHRMIMLSRVYQQSSAFQKEAAAADLDNRLLWRYPRHRLEGEAIRDSMLFASGLLSSQMGGPGVFPEVPEGAVPRGQYNAWRTDKDAQMQNRRSVYIFVKRNMPYPMLDVFDAVTQESCARRFQTVIPTQALTLMNDPLVRGWSQALAGRLLDDSGLSAEQQVEKAFRIVLSRAPSSEEQKAVQAFLAEQSREIRDRMERKQPVALPENVPAGMEPARAAALVDLCHALLNSNEFLYVN